MEEYYKSSKDHDVIFIAICFFSNDYSWGEIWYYKLYKRQCSTTGVAVILSLKNVKYENQMSYFNVLAMKYGGLK